MGSSAADDSSKWPCGLIETSAVGTVTEVNDTVVTWTGRARSELLGRHLRDLLAVGSRVFYETHIAPMVGLQGAADEVALDLLAADGSKLSALVNVASRRVGTEDRLYFSIVQATQRRSYERELLQARREAEAATAAAERAQDKLELRAEVNVAMSEGLELPLVLRRVAELLARRRRGVCFVVETGVARGALAVGSPTSSSTESEALADRLFGVSRGFSREWPAWLRLRVARLQSRPPSADSPVADDAAFEGSPSTAAGAVMIVPILVRGLQVGTIVLVREDQDSPYEPEDLDEMSALSHRIGLHMENLRLSAGEHDRAMALQRALLTPAVHTDGLAIATTYLPSAEHAMVGGDWYDSFVRPDGTTVLVIGDVTGHDHVAAAAMGQLRGLLRAVAYLSVESPAQVLSIVDDTARGLGVAVRATAILAYLGPPDASGVRTLDWANAGHLPPAVVTADATVHWLDDKPDLMLGVQPDCARRDLHRLFEPGDTVVFYTDGLVENRRRDIDVGLKSLEEALKKSAGRPLNELSTDILATLATGRQEDDIALLVVRGVGAFT